MDVPLGYGVKLNEGFGFTVDRVTKNQPKLKNAISTKKKSKMRQFFVTYEIIKS